MILRKRAWDVMREDFYKVAEKTTLSGEMAGIREHLKRQPESHLFVVVDDEDRYKGVFTAWDVLKVVEDVVMRDADVRKPDDADWDTAFTRACAICGGVEMGELTHRKVPTVRPNSPLVLILNDLVETKRNWAVVEEGGKAIGVILIGDLFREITREMVKAF